MAALNAPGFASLSPAYDFAQLLPKRLRKFGEATVGRTERSELRQLLNADALIEDMRWQAAGSLNVRSVATLNAPGFASLSPAYDFAQLLPKRLRKFGEADVGRTERSELRQLLNADASIEDTRWQAAGSLNVRSVATLNAPGFAQPGLRLRLYSPQFRSAFPASGSARPQFLS